MTRHATLALRVLLSLVGGVAGYLAIYWLTGWGSHVLGYGTPTGRLVGLIDGLISPLAFGIVVALGLAIVVFWTMPKATSSWRRNH